MEIATRRREQEVWQACDDLWALHGDVRGLTGDSIRDHLIHLGKSRGSPNEIYKYKKTWVASRGLNVRALHTTDTMETDPISRAVKLVHEQLRNEAHDQIALLKDEFEQGLNQKEEEVKKAKNALDAVMIEFGELQNGLLENRLALKTLEEQMLAEIEVRKACEREILTLKALREQENAAHTILVNEIKQLHLQELAHLDRQAKEREIANKMLLEKLLEEKKQLGFEYSEKLNELKTVIYNQDLLSKEREKRLMESQSETHQVSTYLDSKNKQIEVLKQDIAQISSALSASSTELHILRLEKKAKAAEYKRLAMAAKKSELTIARLRTYAAMGTTRQS